MFLPSVAQATFSEMATGYGLATPGTKDGGLVWADFNGDGFPDVLVNSSEDTEFTRSTLLFWNGGTSTFVDVTATHAPQLRVTAVGRSAIAADVNNDGYVDFARCGSDFDDLVELFINRGPDASPPFSFGTADDAPNFVIDSVLLPGLDCEGLGWLDRQNDGWLDLVVETQGAGVVIFDNPGDGSVAFVAATDTGLPLSTFSSDYLAVTDFDSNGFVDIAVRRDTGFDLFSNDGDGSFTAREDFDLSAPNSNKGGIVFCDFDDDGDWDLFWSDGGVGSDQIYENDAGAFIATGVPLGLADVDIDGIACGDTDNDGDVDLFLSNDGLDLLFVNQGGGNMSFLQSNQGIDSDGDGEAAAMADFDRDGDVDLLINQTGANALFVNDQNDADYLMVRALASVASCPGSLVTRDDLGAVLQLLDAQGEPLSGLREINGGKGHGSQDHAMAHFGLGSYGGAANDYRVRIRFQYGAAPEAIVAARPDALGDYQLLEVVHDDPDADGILTSDELGDTAAALLGDDVDGDGLANWNDLDADGDGIGDGFEAGDTDRCTPASDTDEDGVVDYLDSDSDNDDLLDADEVTLGTNPYKADTDGDGLSDGAEVAAGSDPLDPDDPPPTGVGGSGGDAGTVGAGGAGGVPAGAAPALAAASSCGCRTGSSSVTGSWLLLAAALLLLRRRTSQPPATG